MQIYKEGQTVTMFDRDDCTLVRGQVLKVEPEYIIVKWNDIDSPCKHYHDEYINITPI